MKTRFDNLTKPIRYTLILLIILSSIISATNIISTILMGSSLDHVSGAWIGLAMDLKDGIFYRPLYSDEIGFGGTRFFPLFFSLHALLILFFGIPLTSGHIVSIFSGLLLFVACFVIFRQMKINFFIIFGLLTLLLSVSSIQLGLTTIRADILPVALNIIGIAFVLSKLSKKYKIIFASVFFTLAFSAKMTAINGILAVFLWLIFNKRIKEAFSILLFTSIGYILFLAILYFGTSGRIISIFVSCSSGGANLLTVIKAPILFLINAAKFDWACLLLSLWILYSISWRKISPKTNLFFIFWLSSIIITTFIFGSPGTNYNHLVDVSTASILLAGSLIYQNISQIKKSFIYFFSIIIVFSIIYNVIFLRPLLMDEKKHINKHYPAKIVNLCAQDDALVLSEDPMLPILANKRPYLLDPFMLRLVLLKDTNIRLLTLDSIDQKKYSAIIFIYDPLIDIEWYSNTHFGYEFIQKVIQNYRVGMKYGNNVVYFPDFSASSLNGELKAQ